MYIDEKTGQITLPADQFFLSDEEKDEVISALGVALIACVERAGIDSVEQPRRVIPDNPVSRTFGLWRHEDAERYGYVVPELPEKLAAIEGDRDAPVMTAAEVELRQQCATDPSVVPFHNVYPHGPWVSELSTASMSADQSEEA